MPPQHLAPRRVWPAENSYRQFSKKDSSQFSEINMAPLAGIQTPGLKFCLKYQNKLVNWAIKEGCSCGNLDRPYISFFVSESVDNTGQMPMVPCYTFVNDQDQVSLFKVSPGTIPFWFLLKALSVFSSLSWPKYVSKVLDSLPSFAQINIFFLEVTRRG